VYRFCDKVARSLTGSPNARVRIYFNEYSKEDNDLDAEMSYPFVEGRLVDWANDHPVLALLASVGMSFVLGLNFEFRKDLKNARTDRSADPPIDVEP
jgi:hypothetical protein